MPATLTKIRIDRPQGKWGRWVIRARRDGYEHALSGRDLRETIEIWRYARQRDEARAAAELERLFLNAYGRLADEGACDAPGAPEYQRVRAEWIAAGRRPEIETFIRARANIPWSDW